VHPDQLPGTFFGPSNLVDLVRHRVRHQLDDVAFIYLVDGEREQTQITYRQLDRKARAIGAWLESHGLTGERALLLYPPGLDFITAFFGCLYAGVVAVPVYPPRRNRSLDRIQTIAEDAEAKIAITTDTVLNRVEPLVAETPGLQEMIWLATCDVTEEMAERWEMPNVNAETLAFLQYTSGSTGEPKGVMLNHGNLMHNSALIAYAFEHTRSGSGVFWLPSYHDMGLIGGILQPLYIGRPNILMSPMSFLQKPFRWLSAVSRYGGTTSGGPNFAYDLCVRRITPEQRATLDLSRWKVAFNGAEPVRNDTIEKFTEMFAPCGFNPEAFYPCYGLAEATLIVSGGFVPDPPEIRSFDADKLLQNKAVETDSEENARRLISCGGALLDEKIAIANPQTRIECKEGQVGEIWASSPSVANGYWRKPELSEKVFKARLKGSGEGPFLRTGDLGFLRNNQLFVTGRIKDLIILRGVNHYPQDIEQTVQQAHQKLRIDCGAAFTVEEDGRDKLIIVQEIERHKTANLEEIFSEIVAAVSAEHEVAIDEIMLIRVGSIPKTSSGKVQRHACRTGFLNGALKTIGVWKANGRQPTTDKLETAKKERAKVVTPQPSKRTSKTADKPGPELVPSDNGQNTEPGKPPSKKTSEIVFEHVQTVAKERAKNLTMDMPIIETGLDSLERIEILASLEETFGGRFPEEILADLETCNDVVAAVEKYLGKEPRVRTIIPPNADVPPEYYQIDKFPEYLELRKGLDTLDSIGLANPFFKVHEGLTNDHTTIGGKELISFSGYNYVGMSGDPIVTKASQDAAAKYGTSASASRLVSGEKTIHAELEREIADFMGVEDAVVLVGGHATNETTIGHLFGPSDLILHDSLSHNSIVQGCILSGARRRPFPHNDWEAADKILKQFRHEYRRVLIVVEGVYSMDGDIPDLKKFVEVKNRHNAILMVDEAHSIGTIGPTGHGISEYCSVNPKDVEIWMCTLSKTFGSCGGFIAGTKELVQYLKYTAPGFVFSVALPPPSAGAALASLRLLKAEPERVNRLQERSQLFLELAQKGGLNTGLSRNSPVIPIILGNSVDSLKVSKALENRGINVQPILYPAVEESAARLRFFITSQHTPEQIRYTVKTLLEELEKIDPKYVNGENPSPKTTVKST